MLRAFCLLLLAAGSLASDLELLQVLWRWQLFLVSLRLLDLLALHRVFFTSECCRYGTGSGTVTVWMFCIVAIEVRAAASCVRCRL